MARYTFRPRDAFGTNDPVEIATRMDDFTDTLNKSFSSPYPCGPDGIPMVGRQAPQSGLDMLEKAMSDATVLKSVSAETVESIRTQLAQADIGKDLTLTNPISSGLVAFDLEAPSKKLYPTQTPMRNRIPRKKGIGTSHRFKVITGISGSQTGVSDVYPGITDTSTATFGSVSYIRGPKINYAGYDVAVGYSQFGLSDQVNWSAQFSGQGFEDIRQLSQQSVLYASMLEEEKIIISGRGTGSGFSGALTAPASITLTARAPVTGETGISGVTTNVYAKVTADAGPFGQSVLSSAANVAATAGQVVDVTVGSWPVGAPGIRVYVSTGASDPGDAARWYAGRTGSNVFTIQGALPTSGVAASTVTADTSAYAAGYDGILATCLGANSGYVNRVNGTLNTSNPGAEFFKAFDVMYQANGADPDEVLLNGSDRRQLSDLLKTTTGNYRLEVQDDQAHGMRVGTMVIGMQNEVTNKMVDISVSRYVPQGVAPIISWTLPLPNSEVSDVWEMRLVQDYMGISWPIMQHTYDYGSFWYGALICQAPMFNGAIAGIKLT